VFLPWRACARARPRVVDRSLDGPDRSPDTLILVFDRIGRWLRSGVGGERLLFVTHVPEFQAPQWRRGEFVDHQGEVFLVTRWVEGRRVPLDRGGSVQEWEVWGRPVDPEEVGSAVEVAAQRVLAEEARRKARGG
jgi:hypothetical protein